jgi:uncharacterized protein YjiS (DUF1127 family)
MTKTNHNQVSGALSLGKFGNLFFTRQPAFAGAETHSSVFSAIVGLFQAWRAQRAAGLELAGLSDRELADIGVSRQNIPTLVRIRR